MFLLSGCRDIGPHLKMRQRHGVFLELGRETQDSSRVATWNSGFISCHSRGIGPHLELKWETRVSSQAVMGNLVFLSSCDGDLGFPVKL